jgi:uncharacterized membrane protein
METVLLSAENARWDGPWWGGLIFLLFFGLLFVLIVFKVFWWGPWRWRGYWDEDADAILKRRLASGQITEDDYRRLKQAMSE